MPKPTECGLCGGPSKYVGISGGANLWYCACGYTTREPIVRAVAKPTPAIVHTRQLNADGGCYVCGSKQFKPDIRGDGVYSGRTLSECKSCSAVYDAAGAMVNILKDEAEASWHRPGNMPNRIGDERLAEAVFKAWSAMATVIGVLIERRMGFPIAVVVTAEDGYIPLPDLPAPLLVAHIVAAKKPYLAATGVIVTIAHRRRFADLCYRNWRDTVAATL